MAELNEYQRHTLHVLSDGKWYLMSDLAGEFQVSIRSLVRRGLMDKIGGRRGGLSLPVEVRITDAGRSALAKEGRPGC